MNDALAWSAAPTLTSFWTQYYRDYADADAPTGGVWNEAEARQLLADADPVQLAEPPWNPNLPPGWYEMMAPLPLYQPMRRCEPLSDKSRWIAAGLQMLGCHFGLAGMGRLYLGNVGLGIAQLITGLLTFGVGGVLWCLVDSCLILAGEVRDGQRRRLR